VALRGPEAGLAQRGPQSGLAGQPPQRRGEPGGVTGVEA